MIGDVAAAVAGLAIDAGAPATLGSSVLAGGVNFSVFSRDATPIELLLFDDRNAPM